MSGSASVSRLGLRGIMAKHFLSRKEAARYLAEMGCPLSPGSLGNLAGKNNAGKGPPFHRFRNKVMYEINALRAWAEANMEKVS